VQGVAGFEIELGFGFAFGGFVGDGGGGADAWFAGGAVARVGAIW